jgi:hypothetical protein
MATSLQGVPEVPFQFSRPEMAGKRGRNDFSQIFLKSGSVHRNDFYNDITVDLPSTFLFPRIGAGSSASACTRIANLSRARIRIAAISSNLVPDASSFCSMD